MTTEDLTPAIVRARLAQLGTYGWICLGKAYASEQDENGADRHVFAVAGYTVTTIERFGAPFNAPPTDDEWMEVWAGMSTGRAFMYGMSGIAFWWDESKQDWGTSPNAPKGWPAPTV